MASDDRKQQDTVAEVTARNVAGMRELLDQKAQKQRARGAEPPLEDDPHAAAQENPLAEEPDGSNGSTGGIRNMGGGRP